MDSTERTAQKTRHWRPHQERTKKLILGQPNLTDAQTEEKTRLLKQQNQGAQLHHRTKIDQQNREAGNKEK
jgi:hypothetical protein